MSLTHGLFLLLILFYLCNSLVSILLVGHVFYSVDLMFAMYFSYFYLMIHRYQVFSWVCQNSGLEFKVVEDLCPKY